ncbi:MAG: hypothetical protein DCC68_14465 [Planctomycetota bacterium]|nr:MAG: hypothetical protein DCC68_14465 [Planctomycetota bacterium]
MVDMHRLIAVVGIVFVEFRSADTAGWQVHRDVLALVVVEVERTLLGGSLGIPLADGSARRGLIAVARQIFGCAGTAAPTPPTATALGSFAALSRPGAARTTAGRGLVAEFNGHLVDGVVSRKGRRITCAGVPTDLIRTAAWVDVARVDVARVDIAGIRAARADAAAFAVLRPVFPRARTTPAAAATTRTTRFLRARVDIPRIDIARVDIPRIDVAGIEFGLDVGWRVGVRFSFRSGFGDIRAFVGDATATSATATAAACVAFGFFLGDIVRLAGVLRTVEFGGAFGRCEGIGGRALGRGLGGCVPCWRPVVARRGIGSGGFVGRELFEKCGVRGRDLVGRIGGQAKRRREAGPIGRRFCRRFRAIRSVRVGHLDHGRRHRRERRGRRRLGWRGLH